MAAEGTGNDEQGTGNRECRTGNDEQGTEEFRTGSSSRQPPSAICHLNNEQGTDELRNEGSSRQPSTINRQPLQAAFTVPRRQFKKAVHRNRIKRLMREAWRLQKNPLQEILVAKGIQLRVFIVYTGRDLPEWTLVQEKVQRIIARLQKSIHEKPADHS